MLLQVNPHRSMSTIGAGSLLLFTAIPPTNRTLLVPIKWPVIEYLELIINTNNTINSAALALVVKEERM